MLKEKNKLSRRDFLKAAGAASVGSILTAVNPLTEAAAAHQKVPTRPFGKTGINVPVSDVMRCLMYARSYGNPQRTKIQFQKLPVITRRQITLTDYSLAEQRCPQKMAISKLMKEAVKELS